MSPDLSNEKRNFGTVFQCTYQVPEAPHLYEGTVAGQAIYINKKNEGETPGGRMHNMLSLNLAIMQLERGRLNSARQRFREIIKTEDADTSKIHFLSVGYLGLIAQLTGHLQEAKTNLTAAIDALHDMSEDRATAIFKHHFARLMAREDFTKAKLELKGARELAESGGHEDIRHRIMLSEVWVSQVFTEDGLLRIKEDRLKLREVEAYAYMMGMLSLLVDTLHAKGNLLLATGDTSSSGKLMTKAMAIARRNDMTLRLNTIMTNYARVLIARRRGESALRLLDSALAMGKRCEYSTEVVFIHKTISEAKRSLGDE